MKRFCSLFINIILSVMVYGQDEIIVPHIVQRGETINILASRFKTSVETLKMLNNDIDEFYTGMNVFLPRPNELRNTSELSIDAYDVLLKEVEEYWSECDKADRLFAKSKFQAAHKYYEDIINRYSVNLNCNAALYGMAVCSYHAKKWKDTVQEFNQVIKSSGCSEKVRKVSENYKEEALAQIEQRKANRNLFWQNLGEAFLQVGQMTLQAYADVNSQNSNPYSGGIVSVSSGNNLYPDLPVAFNPNRVARMSVPTYSFDSNGNMMMSFPGFAQAEYEMNAALQQTISNTSSNLMATGDSYHMAKAQSLQVMAHTNNWMSSLSQQFWSTPMYPSAWSETGHKYSSTERKPSIEKNTNTKGNNKCIRLGIYDYAHCGGTGICSRCDGKKKYFSNAYGISRWYECLVCHKTGVCPSCHGN